MSAAVLAVDVVSDVVCPWCYLGKRRLERAVASVPHIPLAIRWRPYRLDPTIPSGGIDRRDYIIGKFGSLDALDRAHESLIEMGRAEGIAYNFERIARSPNTVDAHRLARWAAADGREEAMIERLFSAYFVEGRDVGDRETLAALAGEVGLDAGDIERRLAGEEDRAATIAEIEQAFRIGVTGVPCFIFGGRAALMGAQPAEVIAKAIEQIAAQTETIDS